jgi:hypothetical protein
MGSLWGPFTETFEERKRKLDELLGPLEEKLKTVVVTPAELRAAMEKADERVAAFRTRSHCTCSCPYCARLD